MYLFAISWQSILAGTITTLAISIVMALLGVALGFTVIHPRSEHPTSGLGAAFGVWGIISVIVSLAAGGFASGLFSAGMGAEHGFMVWATVLIVGALFSGLAVSSAMRSVGALARSLGSGAVSVASTVGSSVEGGLSELAHSAVDHIQSSVNLDFHADRLDDKIASTLRDTGVPALRPENLKEALHQAKSDLRAALGRLRFDSDNNSQVLSEFLNKQKNRLDNITKDVDKNAAVNALMQKRNIGRLEAEEEVDNAVDAYNQAVDKAREAMNEAHRQIDDAREHFREAVEDARIKADKLASSAARSALAAALALVVGAAVCMYAGYFGNRYSDNYVVAYEQTVIDAGNRQAVKTIVDNRPNLRTAKALTHCQ